MKVITSYCDNPEHDGEFHEASEVQVTVAGKSGALDLCEPCRKVFVDPLAALLESQGQPVAPKAKASKTGAPRASSGPTAKVRSWRRAEGSERCPLPGCEWPPGVRSALSQHTLQVHGEQVTVLEGRHGRLLPDGTRMELPFKCPSCEAAYAKQGPLTTHQHKVHA